jgi:hypothetical protein
MQSIVSLSLIVQAEEEIAAGRYREAGRLALEAADSISTVEEADELSELAALGLEQCEFGQRGRFESALELAEERRAELSTRAT